MPASEPQRPIASVDELTAHFVRGGKSPEAMRIGVEHEKVGVLSDGRAPDYPVIKQILEAMAERGWKRKLENGNLIALAGDVSGTITLEPGGQLEHSGAPWPTARAATADNEHHLDELLPVAERLGVRFLAVGFRPFGTLDDVPWMPKGRYRVMREYLPTRGRLAHEMMKRTTTVQANLDYTDEDDAMDKLRVAMSLSSLVTSLFAASPIVDGKLTEYQSYRARAWLETDPDRCGILPFALRDDARFRDYVEWALDVPMFFVHRPIDNEAFVPVGGITFRRFMREGFQGVPATLADWELHLSTLYPEVRLKTFLEVRQADASSREMVGALPALWRGVLYDVDARRAAWELTRDWTLEERLQAWRETPLSGMHGRVAGKRMLDSCRELVAIARAGLGRLNGGVERLAPLEAIVADGRTRADVVADAWKRTDGAPEAFIEAVRLR
jgi:glutamate--cysteine ligase